MELHLVKIIGILVKYCVFWIEYWKTGFKIIILTEKDWTGDFEIKPYLRPRQELNVLDIMLLKLPTANGKI